MPPTEFDPSCGHVIHSQRSRWQDISVLEHENLRLLRSGDSATQSAMDLTQPQRLVLPYMDAMMAWPLFGGHCQRSLLLGLGGGDLVRYLLHYYPQCQLDVVEQDEAMIRLCREYFALPDSPRLTTYVDDANNFLHFNNSHYDLVLLDIYHDGKQPGLDAASPLYSACHARLSEDGILVVNFLPRDAKHFSTAITELRALFDGRTLCLTVPGFQNVVVLGFKKRPATVNRAGLDMIVQSIGRNYGLDYEQLLSEIFRSNPTKDDNLIL